MSPLRLVACLLVASALACASGDGNDDGSDSGIPTTTLTSSASSSGDATSDSSGTTTSTSSSSSETGCTPGSEGCTCADGQCLGGELICVDDLCQMPSCTPDPDFQSDGLNCGKCGNECRDGWHYGPTCSEGQCAAQLGPCQQVVPSCDESCAAIGETCLQGGCGSTVGAPGFTVYSFGPDTCADPGLGGTPSGLAASCSDMLPTQAGSVYRCCCTDSGSMP